MATAIIEIDLAIPGLTGLVLDLYPHTSDTIAANDLPLTEEANRDGVYRTTTTAGLSGLHAAKVYSGSALLATGYVYMSDTAVVHVVQNSPAVGDILATSVNVNRQDLNDNPINVNVTKVNGLDVETLNKVDANMVEIDGDSGAAERLAKSADTICFGTVTTGASATVVPTSAFNPSSASLEADQFRGRVLIFRSSTTTAQLKGQSAVIESNTGGATPTFTLRSVDALTETPASGDVFVVV